MELKNHSKSYNKPEIAPLSKPLYVKPALNSLFAEGEILGGALGPAESQSNNGYYSS